MKKDITTKKDIETLVNAFYEKVKTDETLAHFFAHVNWEKHLPLMYDFWENTLFYTGTYRGNPMKLHEKLHHIKSLSEKDFEAWINLFVTTLTQLFEGEKTELAKQRAISIATVMKLKILYPQNFVIQPTTSN